MQKNYKGWGKWDKAVFEETEKLMPDLMFWIFDCHKQITITVHLRKPLRGWGYTLALILGEDGICFNNLREWCDEAWEGDMAATYFFTSIENGDADFVRVEY